MSLELIGFKVVDMVERRFSALAGQTMATMQLRLNIDPMKKQLSFRFGPDQRSSKVCFHSNTESKSFDRIRVDPLERLDHYLEGKNPTVSSALFSHCGIL